MDWNNKRGNVFLILFLYHWIPNSNAIGTKIDLFKEFSQCGKESKEQNWTNALNVWKYSSESIESFFKIRFLFSTVILLFTFHLSVFILRSVLLRNQLFSTLFHKCSTLNSSIEKHVSPNPQNNKDEEKYLGECLGSWPLGTAEVSNNDKVRAVVVV